MNIGQYIKDLRINKGYTQEELGNLVGIQRAAVQKWESGITQNLKRTTIQKLAEIFEVNPSSFITDNISAIENETTQSNSLDDEFIAFYGEVKKDLDENDIADLKTFMRMKAEIKRKNEKKV